MQELGEEKMNESQPQQTVFVRLTKVRYPQQEESL